MRILHITTYLEGGGAETHIKYLSKELVKRGHEVAIFYMRGTNKTQRELEKQGVIVVKGSANLAGFIKLVKFSKEFKPRIVHAHLFKGELFAIMLKALRCKKQPFKLIVMRHVDYWPYKPRRLLELFQSTIVYPFADRVVAISYAVYNYIRDKMGYMLKNLDVIHYGIPLINYATSNHYRPKNAKFVFGFAGRLVNQKGLDVLLNAAYLLDNKYDFHILVAGDGELRDRMQRYASRLKNIKVLFLGFVSDIHNFYESIDVFVFPSRFEGFGLVALEAMIHGKPVIGSKVSSIPEVIGDAGLLFEKENHRELATLMEKVLNLNSKQLAKLRDKIKKQIKRYDINLMVKKYEKMYAHLLSQ